MDFFFWATAATLNAFMALFAVCMFVSGESAYRYVGFGNWLNKTQGRGIWLPQFAMIVTVCVFAVIIGYCIAGIGFFELPHTYTVLLFITGFYLLRGSLLFFDRFLKQPVPVVAMFTGVAALLTGAVQALAMIVTYYI